MISGIQFRKIELCLYLLLSISLLIYVGVVHCVDI
jgi:hypothetical protein